MQKEKFGFKGIKGILSRDEMKKLMGGYVPAECDGKEGSICSTAANCKCSKGLTCDSGEEQKCIKL